MLVCLEPIEPGEIARGYDPIADVMASVREAPSYSIRGQNRLHFHARIGEQLLAKTRIAHGTHPHVAMERSREKVLPEGSQYLRTVFKVQARGMYRFEEKNTGIRHGAKISLEDARDLLTRICADYHQPRPGLQVNPKGGVNEYQPMFRTIFIAAQADPAGDRLCPKELVTHEAAHALLHSLDQRGHAPYSAHHPYFARLLIDLHARYNGYDRDDLVDKATKAGLFGPLDPYNDSHWRQLPRPMNG